MDRVPHEDVPRHLCQAHAGLFFLRGGIGAESCSPTKVGEYWACGLPVMMNGGIGDLDDVVRRQRVGVVVRGLSPADLEDASRELLDLLSDPAISERCRRAAEEHYSLEVGVQRQAALYDRLAGGPSPNSPA
jgi:glycosyltransferase involved in cell wall biosynthesis